MFSATVSLIVNSFGLFISIFFFTVAQASPPTQTQTLPLGSNRPSVVSEISGANIKWTRTVKDVAQPVRHFEIDDDLTNQGPDIQGVFVHHEMAASLSGTWLGGQHVTSIHDWQIKKLPFDFSDPWNPTVFVQGENGLGVGLVARDDVFRQQVQVYQNVIASRAGLKSEQLCLGGHQHLKIRWSAYDVQGTYWDFINSLRKTETPKTNVPGSFIWFMPDDILNTDTAFLREHLEFQNVAVASLFGGWVDRTAKIKKGERPVIGFGTEVLSPAFSSYRERIHLAIQKLKFIRPKLKVLVYFDVQRDSSPKAAETFHDSVVTSGAQQIESTDWQGQYQPSVSVYPTLDNSFGRQIPKVTAMVHQLGADGLYWDEMESLDYSGIRFTNSQWDGFSCRLNSDGTVKEKIGALNLLSEPAKLSYAKSTTTLLANSPPTTGAFSARADWHMIEGQHFSDYSSYAHLTTPLAFIGSATAWADIIAPIDRALLPTGVRLDYKTPLFKTLYPIQVLKIYPGVIIGEGKIITTHGGTFGFKEACTKMRVSVFDSQGQPVVSEETCQKTLKLGDHQLAIFERLVPAGPQPPLAETAYVFDRVDR